MGFRALDINGRLKTVGATGPAGATGATGPAGSGGLVLLEEHTAAASASLDFSTRNVAGQSGATIQSDFNEYLIIGDGIVPATSTADLRMQVGTGVGPTFDTASNYEWAVAGIATSGAAANTNGTTGAGARIFLSMGNTAGWAGSFSLKAFALNSVTLRKTFIGSTYFINSAPLAIAGSFGCQWVTAGTAATALRFLMSAGNITVGTIQIYGVAK